MKDEVVFMTAEETAQELMSTEAGRLELISIVANKMHDRLSQDGVLAPGYVGKKLTIINMIAHARWTPSAVQLIIAHAGIGE